ncbi:flagellar biosynthetic protein FliO [bacterium]|nr:flagellar biosynthetic protein FliO [bacterium]
MRAFILFAVVGTSVHAGVLQNVRVTGEDQALVQFEGEASTPRLTVDGNHVELVFSGTTLGAELTKNGEISSPHALVQRIKLHTDAQGATHATLTVNGSEEKLRDRVKLQKTADGVNAVLSFPAGSGATFQLLKEEQASIAPAKTTTAEGKGGFGVVRLLLVLFLFAATGIAAWYFVKFTRKQTSWRGSRKHLIETVAQTSVGESRGSVAILRVGGEFVMVGVTSQNISFLSNLPKLAAQYEEDSTLERQSFRDAMVEQAKKTTGLSS